MPISIVDYEQLLIKPGDVGLFRNLWRMNELLWMFPLTDVGAKTIRGTVIDELPQGHFRDLNENYTPDTGKWEPRSDVTAIFGGSFTDDEAHAQFTKEVKYTDPVMAMYDMYTISTDRDLTDTVFNGDIDTNEKSFNGLAKRFALGEFPAANIVKGLASDALDVLNGATEAKAFFKVLDEALYRAGLHSSYTESGAASGAIFLNGNSWLGFQAAAQLCGLSLYAVDIFERKWTSYRGIPIVDVGLKTDQTTEIILDTYDPGDAGDDATKLFVTRFASVDNEIDSPGSDGLHLIQAGTLRKLGPIERLTHNEYGLEWILGMSHIGDDYCASVVENVKFA